MARKQYDLLVGAFALGALIVLGYMILQFGGGVRKYRDTITVVGEFNQAGRLIINAPVYLSGVEIGAVTKIEVTAAGKVHIHMRVARQAGLRTSDVPEIAQSGVLGEVTVNFIRGEQPAGLAADGAVFKGKDPVDIIKQAERAISLLTNEETVARVQSILGNVDDITSELHKDLENMRALFTPEFFDDARTIVAQARAASEDLPELTRQGTLILRETRTSLVDLARHLSKNAKHVDSILASVDEILATTARGQGTIGNLVKNPELYDSGVSTLDALRDAIVAIKYNGPFWGRRIKAEEEAAAAEAAQRAAIWRR
jgi:phospholipid/cholesterol/gamma-HCH transport system substrate-binding protein